jgi:hypothetical protein
MELTGRASGCGEAETQNAGVAELATLRSPIHFSRLFQWREHVNRLLCVLQKGANIEVKI